MYRASRLFRPKISVGTRTVPRSRSSSDEVPAPSAASKEKRDAALRERGLLPPLNPKKDVGRTERRSAPLAPIFVDESTDGGALDMTGDVMPQPSATSPVHENSPEEESEPCVPTPLHLPFPKASATCDFSEINAVPWGEIPAARSLSDVSHGISFATSTDSGSEFSETPPFDASHMNTSAGRGQNLGHGVPGMAVEQTRASNSNRPFEDVMGARWRRRSINASRDKSPPNTKGRVRLWAWLFNMHRSVVAMFSRSRRASADKGSGFDA